MFGAFYNLNYCTGHLYDVKYYEKMTIRKIIFSLFDCVFITYSKNVLSSCSNLRSNIFYFMISRSDLVFRMHQICTSYRYEYEEHIFKEWNLLFHNPFESCEFFNFNFFPYSFGAGAHYLPPSPTLPSLGEGERVPKTWGIITK
jgi:hypothetical protein